MNYKASIIGFHNPYLHKDLSPAEFLNIYIKSQERRFKGKTGYGRKKLVDWIKDNWDSQLKFVARLFPNTLKGDQTGRTAPPSPTERALKRPRAVAR